MANRARDEVIYIRVDEALKKRFDRIKEASGYKGNADFLNYLLDVYDGKRVDGVTLKDIRVYWHRSFRYPFTRRIMTD